MPPSDRVFHFGGAVKFTLDEAARTLVADGKPVELGGRAFDTLLALLRRSGEMVSRAALMDAVWPDAAVEDNNLSVQISFLRKALGDRHIRTVPGRGYCLVPDADGVQPDPAGADGPAPALASHLPGTLKPLIGRDKERAKLARLLRQEPLVCVLGPAGVGKTLLVQHVLRQLEPEFRHGVCFVDLAQVPADGDIGGTVGACLGTHAHPATGDATLLKQLAPLEMLLALDNAEHVPDAVAQFVARISECAPRVRVAVTSQARLKLPLEKVLVLGALEIPPRGASLTQAMEYGAFAMFARCSRAVSSRFELADADIALAIELCAAIDGLPLAIELAAARAPHLGVAKLLQTMESRLAVLHDRRPNAPERQQSMRAALQWSHDLLSEDERAVFRRLAAVCGSLELDLLLDILAGDGEGWQADRWSTLDVLMTLVDRGLVDVMPGRHNLPRYRLLETPKVFARELLQASPDSEAAARRHGEALAAALGEAYLGAAHGSMSRSAWKDRHQDEYHDATAAMDWATRHARPDLVARLAPALLLLTPDGDVAASRRHYQRCMEVATTSEDALARFLALDGCTWQWPSGTAPRSQLAADLLQAAEGTAHLPDFGKRLYIAQCKYVASMAMQQDVAVAQLQQLLATARQAEDPAWPAALRRTRCIAEIKLARRLGDAGAAYLQSLAYSEINARAGIAPYFSDIAIFEAAMLAGRLGDAVDAARRALQAVAGSRDLPLEMLVRSHLVTAYLMGDNVTEGLQQLRIVVSQTAPDSIVFAYLLVYAALGAALAQQWETAARLFGSATKTLQDRGLILWGHDQQAAERTEAIVRAHLPDARCKALQEEGARLAPGDLLSAFVATLDRRLVGEGEAPWSGLGEDFMPRAQGPLH